MIGIKLWPWLHFLLTIPTLYRGGFLIYFNEGVKGPFFVVHAFIFEMINIKNMVQKFQCDHFLILHRKPHQNLIVLC